MKNNKKYEIDMTNGTIMDKLITFFVATYAVRHFTADV